MVRVVKRKRGDTLMPARFPQSVVAGLKAKAREWSGQYQQDPTPETGVIFNPAWWKFYRQTSAPEMELVVLSVDCSFKSGKEHDLVSIQKWGILGARSYLIEREAEHLGYVATKSVIRSMQHGRPASCILIEDKANGSAIVEELKSDPDFDAAVIAVNPHGDKKSRAFAASADVEAGNVYLPEGAPWLPEFLRTMSTFPAARFDDDVDALSQFLNWRRTRSLSLGLVDYLKSVAAGTRKLVVSAAEKIVAAPKPKERPVRVCWDGQNGFSACLDRLEGGVSATNPACPISFRSAICRPFSKFPALGRLALTLCGCFG